MILLLIAQLVVSTHPPLSPDEAVAVLKASHSSADIANRPARGPGPQIVVFGTPGAIAPWEWPRETFDAIRPLSDQPSVYLPPPFGYGYGFIDPPLVTVNPWTMHAPRGEPHGHRRTR